MARDLQLFDADWRFKRADPSVIGLDHQGTGVRSWHYQYSPVYARHPSQCEFGSKTASAISSRAELPFVTLSLCDAAGRLVPRACPRQRPAELAGSDNGNPTDFDPFYATNRRAFSGCALSIDLELRA